MDILEGKNVNNIIRDWTQKGILPETQKLFLVHQLSIHQDEIKKIKVGMKRAPLWIKTKNTSKISNLSQFLSRERNQKVEKMVA